MNNIQAGPGYMVQLDGLRAIAVAMVILFHWTPEVKQLALGGLGVQLFFVLSGFLIIGILLDARTKAERTGAGFGQIIKSFYARRFLRIFPLFYLVIGAAFVLGVPSVTEHIFWHLAYLSNILIFLEGDWIGEASHLWSLAVEEQFYLLWPFVILFTPRRYLLPAIIGFILMAPVFKLTLGLLETGGSRFGVLPVSSFHYLGAGALLALLDRKYKQNSIPDQHHNFSNRVQWAGIAGLFIFSCVRFVPQLQSLGPVVIALQEFAVIALFASLTLGAAYGFKGMAGKLLAAKPMVYVGQISYGLYLLHNFIPYLVFKLSTRSGVDVQEKLGSHGMLLLHLLILLALSSLLYYGFESRINKYKKYSPYVVAPAQKTGASAVPAQV